MGKIPETPERYGNASSGYYYCFNIGNLWWKSRKKWDEYLKNLDEKIGIYKEKISGGGK